MADVNYGNESINMLTGAERIRKRPASVLGSDGLAGARHGFTEIYGNALDEHSAGYGNRLDVHYYKDGSISVRDYGRGVPLGWNDNPTVKNWNWHVIYNELYGGGKYDDYQAELAKIRDWSKFDAKSFNYLYSVGLNGLGAASTQYTSEFFVVKSYRDGVCTSRSFSHGIPLVNGEPYNMFTATKEEIRQIPEEKEDTTEPDGTYVYWKPDIEVFKDINVGGDWLYEVCRDIAGIAGIELHFDDDVSGKSEVLEAGTLKDVVLDHCKDNVFKAQGGNPQIFTTSVFKHGTTQVSKDNSVKDLIWVCDCNIAFSFVENPVPNRCYHNSVKMQSGVQYEAIDDAISSFMVSRGNQLGVKFTKSDFIDFFMVVVSTRSNQASFRNQTKDAIDDRFIYGVIKDALVEKLELEYGKGNKLLLNLIDRCVEEAQVRVETQKYKELQKQANKAKREKKPDKFTSCDAYEAKKYSEVELWIPEGDSAAGSIKAARDSKFQAIFPIRGKILNVAKSSDKKILDNKEIREIFNILGCGFDLHTKGAQFFNMDNLRVGKIIIATDADEDGYQIRVLLFMVFYKLAPQLIKAGKVFIAETPRFGLDVKGVGRIYARNDAERDKVIDQYPGQVTNISRYKGLGEVDAGLLRETTVAPESRTLVPVTCDLQNETERDLIDALFGADKYAQRKSILSEVLGEDISDMLADNVLAIGEIDNSDIQEGVEYEEVVV